tara:strand:+ start:193 stop:591 length:399 start_codon:yes stop_codon:yes gene_type:complete
MENQKRRTFRPRNNNGFRGRGSSRPNKNGHFQNNNGNNFNRSNGSMTNPFNVEKTILKYQQLAKDAQSMGDPCVVENYLQHADHYSRRLAELNSKTKIASSIKVDEKNLKDDQSVDQKENISKQNISQENKD